MLHTLAFMHSIIKKITSFFYASIDIKFEILKRSLDKTSQMERVNQNEKRSERARKIN